MKKTLLLVVTAALMLTSCKDKNEAKTESSSNSDTTGTTTANQQIAPTDPAKDSADIKKTVLDFYKWFAANENSVMKFHLYSGIKKPDQPPYKINWDEVKKLHDFFRTNAPQLSETFLQHEEQRYREADSVFKIETKEELAWGFDYDPYTASQDPEYVMEEVAKSKQWNYRIDGDQAVVDIYGTYIDDSGKPASVLQVTLQREKGQWKIQKIGRE